MSIKPFLEISVEFHEDPDLSEPEILEEIKESILGYAPIPPKHADITPKPSLFLEFESLDDFCAMYEKDYRIYSYLYDQVLKERLDFAKKPYQNPPKPHPYKNYIVLRYRSNSLGPMRRNYSLIYRVNEFFGSHIAHEEVQDGFLRFIATKQDYNALRIGNDDLHDWLEFFKTLNIDIGHPTIQKFVLILKEYMGPIDE